MLLSRDLGVGAVDVWKLSASVCPDRQMAKGDGALCKLCPWAGRGRAACVRCVGLEPMRLRKARGGIRNRLLSSTNH